MISTPTTLCQRFPQTRVLTPLSIGCSVELYWLSYRTKWGGPLEKEPTLTMGIELQERMIALIRAFGLHKPEQTPCGKPISVAEAHALLELSRESEIPLTQKDLALRLRLEKSTVSRLVSLLEGRGWLQRSRSQEDGRAMELWLTEGGRKAAADVAEARREKFARVLEAIPEGERESVMEALGVLEEAMRESG